MSHFCEDFSILSYNVDGLSDEQFFVSERCQEISRLVLNENPDLVFFQESTTETTSLYAELLGEHGYHLVSSQASVQSPYFTVAFSRVNGTCDRITFPGAATSLMGRDILKLEVVINGRKSLFLSGHFESLGESSSIRIAQLEFALDLIRTFKGPSILAGDLNIRNKEADSVFRTMKKKSKEASRTLKIVDCWEYLGKNDENKNTWTCPEPSLKHIQARYDRVYSNGSYITPIEFKLIGEKVMASPVLTTPSDHFGIFLRFKVQESDGPNDVNCDTTKSDGSTTTLNDDKAHKTFDFNSTHILPSAAYLAPNFGDIAPISSAQYSSTNSTGNLTSRLDGVSQMMSTYEEDSVRAVLQEYDSRCEGESQGNDESNGKIKCAGGGEGVSKGVTCGGSKRGGVDEAESGVVSRRALMAAAALRRLGGESANEGEVNKGEEPAKTVEGTNEGTNEGTGGSEEVKEVISIVDTSSKSSSSSFSSSLPSSPSCDSNDIIEMTASHKEALTNSNIYNSSNNSNNYFDMTDSPDDNPSKRKKGSEIPEIISLLDDSF